MFHTIAMELQLVVGVLLTGALLRVLVKKLFYPRPLPGIPYDKEAARRLSGDRPSIMAAFKELTEFSYPIGRRSLMFRSPIHQLFMNPFTKPWVYIDDPREVSDIVLRRNTQFDKAVSVGVWTTFIPNATIANPMSPEWKVQRRTWQDTMQPDFLRRVVAKNIYAAAKDLTRLWEVRCSQSGGNPVDVKGDFSFAALEAIWTATFGQRLDVIDAQIEMLRTGKQIKTKGLDMHTTVEYINTLSILWSGSFWPAFTRWRLLRSKEYIRYMEVRNQEIDRILRAASSRFQRLLNGSGDGEEHDTCAMDLVLRRSMLAAQKAGKPIPDPTKDVKMRDELLLFIYAGHDTTATTLSWFVKFMANNQEAQAKLRAALRSAFGGPSLPPVDELISAEIPYLEATMQETLRCAGTAGRVMRVATVDTEILGHKIPAGTEIGALTATKWLPVPVPEESRSASSRATLEKAGGLDWTHSPSAQDLEKFVPERWFKIDEKGNEIFDAGALPQNSFGGGTRGCFGRRLAMTELRIMITLTVMSFKFLPLPPELNSFQATELLLRQPRQCFVKLEAA
ncbi:cytochrome P450 [Xylariaceae sp. FL0662B]|nr:cytochrome P450 [Xylariaceae sp. FL0662B]